MSKKTTEQFIEQATKVHNGKFDYSLVEYKNTTTKVKIICPIHGEFEQWPVDHTRGIGCSTCSGKHKYTPDEFINKSKQIHTSNGDNYDYSFVEYKTLDKKVTISCPIHGQFDITPRAILYSHQGCRQCGNNRSHKERTKTVDQFINESNIIHNNKYTYDNVVYVNSNSKVLITCPDHGDFEQTPTNHTHSNRGCQICGRLYSKGLGGYTHEYFQNNPDQQVIPGILYAALINNGKERFIKIGITSKSTHHRFNRGEYKDMNVDILYEKNMLLYEAFCLEQELLTDLKLHKFFSNTKFSGYTECLRIKQEVLTRINEIFQT